MATHVRVQLTDDHKGENVSVQQVPQDWLVPRFHANHSSHQVNQGDGLEAEKTQQSSLTLLIHLHPSKLHLSQLMMLYYTLFPIFVTIDLYNHEITHFPSNQAACLHPFHMDGLRNPNESFNCFNVTVNYSDLYTQRL